MHANEEARLVVSDKRAESVLHRLKDRSLAEAWLQQEHISLVGPANFGMQTVVLSPAMDISSICPPPSGGRKRPSTHHSTLAQDPG
jgi:hypothetical protein